MTRAPDARHDELRTAVGVLQQQVDQIARTVRAHSSRPEARSGGTADAVEQPRTLRTIRTPCRQARTSASKISSADRRRRSAHACSEYLPLFAGATRRARRRLRPRRVPALLREHGIGARGIDLNDAMVDVCRDRGSTPTRRRPGVPARAARRLARRPVRRAGGRTPRARLPDASSSTRVRQAAARRADRARDDQPGVLVRVLRELHPRHHPRPPAASRHAEVPAGRDRLPAGRGPVPRARIPSTRSCSRVVPRAGARRRGRDAERQRRQDQPPAVHLPRLRGHPEEQPTA